LSSRCRSHWSQVSVTSCPSWRCSAIVGRFIEVWHGALRLTRKARPRFSWPARAVSDPMTAACHERSGEPGELAFNRRLVLSAGGSLSGERFHHLQVLLQMPAGTVPWQPNSNPWHRLAADRRDFLCWPAAANSGALGATDRCGVR
jgi:hypothetical protein